MRGVDTDKVKNRMRQLIDFHDEVEFERRNSEIRSSVADDEEDNRVSLIWYFYSLITLDKVFNGKIRIIYMSIWITDNNEIYVLSFLSSLSILFLQVSWWVDVQEIYGVVE